jgi:hypothetical protein
VLALALLLAPGLSAQLQYFVVSGTTEQLLAETYSVGTVTVGDFLDTAFRVRNPTDATLRAVMNVAGAGFNFSSLPAWPPDVPAGGSLDFVVRFQPQTAGLYSAYLNINGVRVSILLGEAAQGITLTVVGGGGIGDLSAGDTIQFGGVPVGESVRKQFELRNPTGRALAVNTLAVAGEAFRGPVGLQAPLTLEAQQRATFEVAFEPKAAGIAAGSLQFDQRSFPLEGIGIVPDYPKPQILIEPQTLSGGQQARVSVRLESASRYTGSGELSIDLRPAVGTGSNQAAAEFQTGTTAGTLVLTARLGKHTVEQTAVIPPAAVVVDSTSVLRSASGLEVKLTGFDTSRTASRVAFTFFDRDWNVIAPGTIGVEVAPAFRQYFDTAGMGGMFLLRAVFPVTGNALKVVAVQTEFTNSHGRTLTPRVGIP